MSVVRYWSDNAVLSGRQLIRLTGSRSELDQAIAKLSSKTENQQKLLQDIVRGGSEQKKLAHREGATDVTAALSDEAQKVLA